MLRALGSTHGPVSILAFSNNGAFIYREMMRLISTEAEFAPFAARHSSTIFRSIALDPISIFPAFFRKDRFVKQRPGKVGKSVVIRVEFSNCMLSAYSR